MIERVNYKILEDLTGLNAVTIRAYLCRPEFDKFYRYDKYFGRRKSSYVFNSQFIEEFSYCLKSRKQIKAIEQFEKYIEKYVGRQYEKA